MKSSRLFIALLTAMTLLHAAAALGGAIDMDDPRRVTGREHDVRIDAQLIQETVSPGSPVGVVYQIQNLTSQPIAIAGGMASASFDEETGTITLAIGAEIPPAGEMPGMELIAPGETKVLRAGATPALSARAVNMRFGGQPRSVQVKVSFLRDVAAFRSLIESGARFPDELFDRWFESQATIFLNAVPVRFAPGGPAGDASIARGADRRF